MGDTLMPPTEEGLCTPSSVGRELDSSFRWNDGELGPRTTVCRPGGGLWVGVELVQALALVLDGGS